MFTPDQIHDLLISRDREHAETHALDLLDRNPAYMIPKLKQAIDQVGQSVPLVNRPEQDLFYQVLWLGWERLLTAWHERHAEEPQETPPEDDDDGFTTA